MIAALLVACVLGACAGSFLGVVIHRLPRGLSIVSPPSRCGSCGTRLAWFENIPIFGWLMLRGHCRHCGTSIPVSCLWLEVAVAAISVLVVWAALQLHMPWLHSPALMAFDWSLWLARGATVTVLLALTWLLIAAVVIDWQHLIIPDEISKGLQALAVPAAVLVGTNLEWGPSITGPWAAITRPWALQWWLQHWDRFAGSDGMMIATPGVAAWRLGLTTALGCAAILASLPLARRIYTRFGGAPWEERDHHAMRAGAWWFCLWIGLWTAAAIAGLLCAPPCTDSSLTPLFDLHVSVLHAILGSLVGWWLPWLVGLVGTTLFRRNAMGYGDVKLFAALGAFLGPAGTLAAFMLAIVVGTLVGIPARLLGSGREMPFGPSLAVGAVLAVAAEPWLATVLSRSLHLLS